VKTLQGHQWALLTLFVLFLYVGTKTSSKDNWEHACVWRDNGCTRWWGGNCFCACV